MAPLLLTETTVAALLAVSRRDVRRLVRRQEIPTVELPGGHVRFDPDALREWVNEQRHQEAATSARD